MLINFNQLESRIQILHSSFALFAFTFFCTLSSQLFAQSNQSIMGQSIGSYISCEHLSQTISCNRSTGDGDWEKFEIENLSNGKVAFKSEFNGLYISSENGWKAMTCSRDYSTPGTWEQFTLEDYGGGSYAIKGNNGLYVSHSQGTGDQLFCTATSVGEAELFFIAEYDVSAGDCGVTNPPSAWRDSYEVNGFCFCNTTYDHGLADEITFEINGVERSIPEICEELENHPGYAEYISGIHPAFNDIQCGNGPPNNDAKLDEQCCPGRVGIGTAGCNTTGANWDIEWLESRPAFSNTDETVDYVNIKAVSNGLYVSSEKNLEPISANRPGPGTWEEFEMTTLANGKVAFMATINDLYVSSENGYKVMNCNRPGPDTWEQFTLENISGNVYAIKGNNGKYVSHAAGTGDQLICTASSIGTYEQFTIEYIASGGRHVSTQNVPLSTASPSIAVYPNPVVNNELSVTFVQTTETNAQLAIVDFAGRTLYSEELGLLPEGSQAFKIENLDSFIQSTGVYFVRVKTGQNALVQKIVWK